MQLTQDCSSKPSLMNLKNPQIKAPLDVRMILKHNIQQGRSQEARILT